MPESLLTLLSALHRHRDAMLEAVPADQRPAVEQRIADLTTAAENAEDPAATLAGIRALLDDYPAARERLGGLAPDTIPPPRTAAPGGNALQWLHELTMTVLAAAIVGTTLWIAARALGVVGDATRWPGAKDLLTVMLGPAGAVLGYYFGRVPAEAHAAAATRRAEEAARDRDRIRGQAHGLAGELEAIEQANAAAGQRGDPPVADTRAVRDRLRAL